MHLPISLDNTLHFYQYLQMNMQAAEGQFLLLIDVPIQSRKQKLQIYEIFNLLIPHGDVPANYEISENI